MFEIINKQIIAENIKRVDIAAENIARKVRPGQFVSVCPEEGDERIPLTVVEHDADKGNITLIFQEKGVTTGKLGSLPINESVYSILGPLGTPTSIEQGEKITVLCIATGLGVARILPICQAFKKAGNKVIGIIGAKSKRKLMLEAQTRLACHRILITTEDGSYERKGLATDVLKEFMEKQEIQRVYAIGSVEMMKAVCLLTKEKKIKTEVQLNPVMVDCIGMCGSCRVKIGGKMKLACVDGPGFDGHKVDFNDLNIGVKTFEETELCHNHKPPSNQTIGGLKTLMKYLSDFQKK
jgi:ferredoxin/flavodoxin---NADP+ reductase